MAILTLDNSPEAFEGLYHVTAHGVGRESILLGDRDKREFLSCMRDYLDPAGVSNSSGHLYDDLTSDVAVLTYALIENHYHVILRELAMGGMRSLMRRTQIKYAMYYNRSRSRRGPVFDRRFEPTPIADLRHAQFAIGYVHLNHVVEQLDYEFTGHGLFVGREASPWIDSRTGVALFGGVDGYVDFMNREGPGIIDRKLERNGMCRQTYKYRPI